MPLQISAGYNFLAGEVQTAFKANLANNGSVVADGQSYPFAAGTSTAPSISFSGDTGTGFYRASAGVVGLTGELQTSKIIVSDLGSGALPASFPLLSAYSYWGLTTDTTTARFLLGSFGGANSVNGLSYGGTRASPSATPADTRALVMQSQAFDGTSTYAGAGMDCRTDGLQSSSNHGSYMIWMGIVNGTTAAPAEWMRLQRGWLNILPSTAPAVNPTSGVYLYVDTSDNKFKARGSSGTVTILANP